MSFHNNTFNQQESNIEEYPDFQEHQTYSMDNKDEDNNNSEPFIKVEINIGNGQIKELNINSIDDIDKSIDDFCIENNLPKEAKKPIKKLLLEELNKKIPECK